MSRIYSNAFQTSLTKEEIKSVDKKVNDHT